LVAVKAKQSLLKLFNHYFKVNSGLEVT